ncbi:MAG: AzlD domain-containing protein [Oscillospiraceae bacterium]|nr:AzlD domain-containing protein [Oscillospiraceae bacterium]
MSFYIYLLAMAGVTYLIRMLPLVLVKNKIENKFILSFLHYIPYSVLTVMTIPAVFSSTGNIYSGLIGFIVALCLAYNKKGLLLTSVLASIAALITELII